MIGFGIVIKKFGITRPVHYSAELALGILRWATFLSVFVIGITVFRERTAHRWFSAAMLWFAFLVSILATVHTFTSHGKIFWLFDAPYGTCDDADRTQWLGSLPPFPTVREQERAPTATADPHAHEMPSYTASSCPATSVRSSPGTQPVRLGARIRKSEHYPIAEGQYRPRLLRCP